MKDGLEKFALLAEIISAIAIVVSLVFVGYQIRQGNEETALNTSAIQATIRQSMLETDLGGLYIYMDHPYLVKRTGLTPDQLTEVKALIIAFVRMREYYWTQYNDGLLDEPTWLSYRQPLTNVVFQSEVGRGVWQDFRRAFNPGFIEDIEEWISTLDLPDLDNVLEPAPE